MMYELLILLIFPGAMAFAAATDFFTMTISNFVSIVLLSGFLVLALWSGMDPATIGLHLAAGAAMLLIGFVMFAFGWIGGGDAKFFAATSIWFGWSYLFEYALAASVYGGLLTIAIVVVRGIRLPDFLKDMSWINRLYRADSGVPYGIALAAAGLMIYPQTFWMN